MKSKKLRAIGMILSGILAIGMAGCQSGTPTAETSKEASQAASSGNKVYLITMDQMDQHWVNVDAGAKKAAGEVGGVDYKWVAPDVKDDAKQIECINNAVAGGANVIMLAANGPDAVTSALKEAESAGVKIVYVDSAADFPAEQTLATDNKAAGATAGAEMLKALEASGTKSGKIGIVNVNASTASVVSREEGFRSAFDGKGFEILETQYCDGDAARAKDIAANYITQGVVGIFGTNEGSTVGTGNAIKEGSSKVVGVGFDKSDTIMGLIDEGFLLCTMAQNPDVMGYEGLKTAAKILKGEAISEKNVDTGVSVLKSDKAPAPVANGAGGKVYLITMDQMDQHWVNVDGGAKKAADEAGNITYTWLAPDVKDDAKQIECINNAVAGGANVILLAANGPSAVTSALKEAESAGVKIIYVDSAADFPGIQTLATDNKAAGATAGAEMLKALEAQGITSGKIGIVNVNASTASVVSREEGFRSAFDGKGFEILETQYCEGDAARAKDIAANYVTQGVVGIFGTNEGSTVGTGNAIKEAGGGIIGVGFDKSDTIMSLIKEGSLLCTMAQNPDVMGYEGMKTAVKVLAGESIAEKNVDTGVSVLTK